MNVVTFLSEKLLPENNACKNYFFSFFPLLPEPLILGEIWELTLEIVFKELINVFFQQCCSSSDSQDMGWFVKNVAIGKIWPLMTSGDLTFDLT